MASPQRDVFVDQNVGGALGGEFGPMPVTPKGNPYILLFTDRFSRRADVYARGYHDTARTHFFHIKQPTMKIKNPKYGWLSTYCDAFT